MDDDDVETPSSEATTIIADEDSASEEPDPQGTNAQTPGPQAPVQQAPNSQQLSPRQRLRAFVGLEPTTPGLDDEHRRGILFHRVLNLPEVQDVVFGDRAPAELEWEDYINVTPYVGPVLFDQNKSTANHDRIMPLRCHEPKPDENGVVQRCDLIAEPGFEVWRCGGVPVDAGHVPGHPNPQFTRHVLAGTINLRYRSRDNKLKEWDLPSLHLEHRDHPATHALYQQHGHCVCEQCYPRVHHELVRHWMGVWPPGSLNPPLQRWFRLCKKHSTLARTLGMRRPTVRLAPHCLCTAMARQVPRCKPCQAGTQGPLDDRAQHWRRELLHTYKRMGRGKRAYVDLNKKARARPVCAWRNCAGRAWDGTRESDRSGLSVCLACSGVVGA